MASKTTLFVQTLAATLSLSVFAPLTGADTPATPWSDFDKAATSIAPQASFLAADISDGNCDPVHALNAEESLGIGSSFKLYILAELGKQIGEGRFRSNLPYDKALGPWEQPVAIESRFKSIPGGPLLFVPDGTIFTVRYLAEQMIQRSDNTATDHLLFLVGRENVEQRMKLMGHHDPGINTPLFATREFAVMKLLDTDEQIDAYFSASTDERRNILQNETRHFDALRDVAEEQVVPVRIDNMEWFANRFDMCKTLVGLYDLGQQPATRAVTEILTLADQLGIDREKFPYVGFKGGSEIGVLAGNWLLVRNDGRRFTMTMAFNDPDAALDQGAIVESLNTAVDILYTTP